MSLIVDATVALKWYVDEPGSAQAATLLIRDDLIAPDLIFAEVGSAFWKLVRRNLASRKQAELALDRLVQDIVLAVPSRELAADAFRLSQKHDHSVYDCLYVALARREDAPLMTADAKLSALAAAAGVESTRL
jgi:predicted nucleic acid-binding protein